MATIRCTVTNCVYWGQSNYCQADQILVTAPASTVQQAEKHGVQAEMLKQTPARTNEATMCYTFSNKDMPS